VVVVAQYRAKPGSADAVAAVLPTYAPLVRSEPGSLCFVPRRTRDDPHAFVLYEQYRSFADLEAHRSSMHYTEIARDRIWPLLVAWLSGR
jgi:quinol monooxygenase YgiN